MNTTSKKGFTIIELLVVIAIIGLLASVVLVGLGGARRSGRDAKRIADLRQLQVGLEAYFTKNGVYPATLSALTTAGVGVTVVPTDPAGAAYGYGVASPATTYTLSAQLEDAGNQALNNDIDGTSNGLSCGTAGPTDLTYCVSL